MLEETRQPIVTLEPLDDFVVVEPSDEEAGRIQLVVATPR